MADDSAGGAMQERGCAAHVGDYVDGAVAGSGNWVADIRIASVGICAGLYRGIIVLDVVDEANIGWSGTQEFQESGVFGGA